MGPMTITDISWEIRAAAHSTAPLTLRAAQRFQNGVTDLDVARVMLALERGVRPYRNRAGRWLAPSGTTLAGFGRGHLSGRNLSTVIGEMIRTGLVRHWIDREGDHLIPAPVHLMAGEPGNRHSACLFTGEDMGPMRSRLVEEHRFTLVDCLHCEQTLAQGGPRGL